MNVPLAHRRLPLGTLSLGFRICINPPKLNDNWYRLFSDNQALAVVWPMTFLST